MSLSRTPYGADGSALVYAGEPAILELQLQAADLYGVLSPEDLTGRVFVQSLIDKRGAVVLDTMAVIDNTGGHSIARMTFTAAALATLVSTAQPSVDLRYVIYEALSDGTKDFITDPSPFSIRVSVDPGAGVPTTGAAGVDAPAARFLINQSAANPRVVVSQRGGRGPANPASVVVFNDTHGLGVTNVQAALDLIIGVMKAGQLDFSNPDNSGLFTTL